MNFIHFINVLYLVSILSLLSEYTLRLMHSLSDIIFAPQIPSYSKR